LPSSGPCPRARPPRRDGFGQEPAPRPPGVNRLQRPRDALSPDRFGMMTGASAPGDALVQSGEAA
jgi:hypothetical protein